MARWHAFTAREQAQKSAALPLQSAKTSLWQ